MLCLDYRTNYKQLFRWTTKFFFYNLASIIIFYRINK